MIWAFSAAVLLPLPQPVRESDQRSRPVPGGVTPGIAGPLESRDRRGWRGRNLCSVLLRFQGLTSFDFIYFHKGLTMMNHASTKADVLPIKT